ncbi:AAA domain-containing protein [Tundrisphaera sp. TA3]|uniref:bifunctional RecB family nuclease/DEAD/DEAH box helicase n=1 Tax=Tundrisphaera sp. TA3 TaxID=3435775 RepID=UPI003EB765AA
MPVRSVSLPVFPVDRPLRLTPTDVSQFVGLEQCERFLRFRLAERAGQDFMEPFGVVPQRMTPLLSLSGHDFEEKVEVSLAGRSRSVHYAARASQAHNRPENNEEVLAEARSLKPGESILQFQPRLEAEIDGWRLRGDVDLLRLERTPDGILQVLVADMKSTAEVKVEHRLQVAFYGLMIGRIFRDGEVAHDPLQTAILFRPPAEPTPEEQAEIGPLREAARTVFGLEDALLEVVADQVAYIQSVHDLVLGADSTARRIARISFDDLPYCLSFKCDGCLYGEFCMKWSAERDDLSLLPYLSGTDKEALRRAGVSTVRSLATLKDFAPSADGGASKELVPAPGREALVKRLAATWPVGPRIDELVHRARSFRKAVRKDGTQSLGYIPGKGNSSLPVSRPGLNPNLVRIYLDAQHDYLEDRIYLLSALVVACRDGGPVGRRCIIHVTDGPPDTAAKERDLFVAWTRELVRAVVDLAISGSPPGEKKSAPVHVVFFDRHEQRLVLEALARNFPPILRATPPLYDFLTQVAAFDSPVASYLDEEVRTSKNFPMTCQSLHSLATFLKFDWGEPYPFRKLFHARMFDYLGKLDIDGQSEWFTRRSRFASSIPLEYAYAAWGQLPPPREGRGDEFADFRAVTTEILLAFQERRLEALEHVTSSISGNPNTEKTPFVLPDLARYVDKAPDLAHALHEFVTIERFVTLADWKKIRHAPPERRVLMGESLLVRYCEADQEQGVAAQNRENERRRLKREEYATAYQEQNPGKKFRLAGKQADECRWSLDGLRFRLRVECHGIDCDLHEALLLSRLRDGEFLVLYRRWAVDERLPEAERSEFTPTPKQMLYGQRVNLVRIEAVKDEEGRITEAFAIVELQDSRGGDWSKPYVFPSSNRPLEEGTLYTLDSCPNEWMSFWCKEVVEGLCSGQPNVLHDRLAHPPAPGDEGGSPGQMEFLAGLDAFHAAGHLHDFEVGKRQLVGGHARTPILLVQGPPGTGKSYSTAFAVFARLQGAMREERPFRAFISCKTHAATDVLLKNMLVVREKLVELWGKEPDLFRSHFDARLLDVPLFRVAPNDPQPEGIIPLVKDAEKGPKQPKNADLILGESWAVVGITPGGTYSMIKKKWSDGIFGHELCDLLVLDESSQMNLPEAIMAALPMTGDAPLLVVGDHRQMPPIVKHDWDTEGRRTFGEYRVYASLFDTLRAMPQSPPMIRYAESFRLHGAMAEFLRHEVYRHDGIEYHSKKRAVLAAHPSEDDLIRAVLDPEYPLVVLVHDEAGSQVRNPFEQALIEPILRTLADPARYGLDAVEGMGVVVPHRAQRAALQQALPELSILDPASGLPKRSAIDTVERFQGGERSVIVVGATESDRGYLLASSDFLLDPRRLTVALSRAKRKMILVASRSIFSVFSPDEEVFLNSQLWKNLLLRTCTTPLWEGDRDGVRVAAWGGKANATVAR